jgi:methylated-DNA-[protein]-cysteine S-methyltransferase
MASLYYAPLETSLGWVGVLASDRGIRKLVLPTQSPQEAVEGLQPEARDAELSPDRFQELQSRLEALFSGESAALDGESLDLDEASPFFRRAWQACRTIPRGETRSYAWLAAEAGSPRAMRAAGQAMARNPVALIIPCHRVIGSDGGLHGYGGGLGLKQRLLDAERVA